jgi:hypothetical protein
LARLDDTAFDIGAPTPAVQLSPRNPAAAATLTTFSSATAGAWCPDGTQRLFTQSGTAANQVVALFRFGVRLPDSYTCGQFHTWIHIMSSYGLSYIMFSYSASESHTWIDYRGLMDPFCLPNWMWMLYGNAG